MTDLLFVTGVFSGIFAFAFGLAWLLPLAMARTEELTQGEQPRAKYTFPEMLADLLLVIADCVPIFSLLLWFKDAPATASAAKKRWREDDTVRICFWLWLAALSTLAATLFIASRN